MQIIEDWLCSSHNVKYLWYFVALNINQGWVDMAQDFNFSSGYLSGILIYNLTAFTETDSQLKNLRS